MRTLSISGWTKAKGFEVLLNKEADRTLSHSHTQLSL